MTDKTEEAPTNIDTQQYYKQFIFETAKELVVAMLGNPSVMINEETVIDIGIKHAEALASKAAKVGSPAPETPITKHASH